MKLKPYPEYKNSGAPWLGGIPEHWSCLPNRAIFREIKDQGHVNEPLLSVTIGRGIIRQADLLADSSKRDSSNLDKSKYKLVTPGDIAYNKMRAWQGAIGVSRHRGIVSPAYIVVRTYLSHNPNYFHFLLRTPGFTTEAERWSYGITSDQWSLRPEHFKMIYCCVPSLEEQDIIVRFLRQLDRQIDRFIRNKERLIELLQEQKQAIINRAVTRGIDPDVRLKPSGIEWLGDVPEHWEVHRNGALFRERVESGDPSLPILVVSLNTGVTVETFETEKPKRLIEDMTKYKRAYQGDIAYNMMRMWQGAVGVAPTNGLVSPAYVVATPMRKLSSQYFSYLFRTRDYMQEVEKYSYGIVSDRLRLYWIRFKNIYSPVPSFEEQTEIVNFIGKKTQCIGTAIRRTRRQIDLISEYRTRLIADVVTGKVDVRGIPVEDVPEDEVLEEFVESREMEEALDIGEIQDAKQ